MMRGSKALSVAVRNPKGEIVIHTEDLDPRIYGGRLAKIPFLRGITLLWDALGLGIKSLMFSAEVALEEEKEEGSGNVFEGPAQWGMVVFSLAFAVFLFLLSSNTVPLCYQNHNGYVFTEIEKGVQQELLYHRKDVGKHEQDVSPHEKTTPLEVGVAQHEIKEGAAGDKYDHHKNFGG